MRNGVIVEIDEVNQRGVVRCTEEGIITSNLEFNANDLTLTSDLIGKPVTYCTGTFGLGGDTRACEVRLVEAAEHNAAESNVCGGGSIASEGQQVFATS